MRQPQNMKDLLLRKLKLEDSAAINKIHTAITQTESITDIRLLIENQIQREENLSFVAELQGKVVGYMFSHIIYSGFGLNKSAWITMMEVDPELMGRGIGKRLAQKIFEAYKNQGIKDIYSSVLWDSTDLLSFFKTLGFGRSNFINLTRELC